MVRILTFLMAATLAVPAFGQTHNLVAADFGGGSSTPPGSAPGAGSSIGSNGPGSSGLIDLDGDGQAETVDFADANGAILGLSGPGGFTPLDHDPVAALSMFDADGDTWLDAAEMDAAGLVLHGPTGETDASIEIAELFLEVVELDDDLCLGGYRSNGDLFGSVLTTATEAAGTVAILSVPTIAIVTVAADPLNGTCGLAKPDEFGTACAVEDAPCVRDTFAGTCKSRQARLPSPTSPKLYHCFCVTGKGGGLIDARLGLVLSLLLVVGATALTLRANAVVRT